jgi:hypothetical protein
MDMNLFYAVTSISICNGKIAQFWESPWLDGEKPKDIALLIHNVSKRKKCTVAQALQNKSWVHNINMEATLTVQHIREYISLWMSLQDVNLHEHRVDSIVWNLTANGEYSSASAYEAQFFGATLTNFNKLMWKVWATPKVKFFSWLTIRNRIWTADRLERRGWDNYSLCQLFKQTQESAAHLFSHYRYSKRL